MNASQLNNVNPLRSLKAHNLLNPSDKRTWDSAYAEEYYGLHENAVVWGYISEKSYQVLRKYTGTALLTQNLTVVKTH